MTQANPRILAFICALLFSVGAGRLYAADVITLVTTAAGLSATDSASWGQLGADTTKIPQSFSAQSTGGRSISGSFATSTGIVAQVSSASSWGPVTGTFSNNDFLLWSFDNAGNTGSGAVTLTFPVSLLGVGATIQSHVRAQFIAKLEVFDNTSASLGFVTVTSNASGDAVFIGATDSTAVNIASAAFSLTSSGSNDNLGNNTGNFALGTLSLASLPFTKLQVLLPGEMAAPGTGSGKTGTPNSQAVGGAFNVTVNAVDANWNIVSNVTDTVSLTSTDTKATLPAQTALVAGTKVLSVTLNTLGSATVTASDVTSGSKTANTSSSITVVSTLNATTTAASNATTGSSTAAQTIPLTATVTSSAGPVNLGTVSFQVMQGVTNIGSAVTSSTLTSGTANVMYVLPAGTAAGSYAIVATYNGGGAFKPSSDNTHTLTVSSSSSTTTAAANATAPFSAAAQNVTLTATVTSAQGTVVGGTVTFQVMQGTSNIGSAVTSSAVAGGSASVTYALPAGTANGTYAISAAYSGGGAFAASSDNTHTLTIATTTSTTVASNASAPFSTAAQNVTLSAMVTSTSGTINDGAVKFQVTSGGQNLGTAVTSTPVTNGSASVSYSLPGGTVPGSYNISASFANSATFPASSDTTRILTVNLANTTTVASNATLSFSTADQTVVLNAAVSSSGGTVNGGTVVFQVKNGPTVLGNAVTSSAVSGGNASVTYTIPGNTAMASYTIQAQYGASTNFNSSSDSAHMLTVGAPASITTIDSGPTATPNPAFASTPVAFSASASNSTGAALTFNWSYGDGASDTGMSVSHTYASAGTYMASVTVSGGDSPVSAPVQVIVSAPAPLTLTSATITLNFASSGKDSVSLAGTLPIPAGFHFAGAGLSYSVGGVNKTFNLDSKGSANNGSDTVKFTFKSTRGTIGAQTAKFSIVSKNGSFRDALAAAGLTSTTVRSVPVTVPFTISFNNTTYFTARNMLYTCKQGKTGTAK